jgi:hypothetical protein
MKGTSPSLVRGEASAASQSGLKMEIAVNIIIQSRGEVMNKLSTLTAIDNAANIITVIGIDLAKNVFALHGINAAGKPILVRPSVRRDQKPDDGRTSPVARQATAWA